MIKLGKAKVFASIVILFAVAFSANAGEKPDILIIGDSISLNYTPMLADMMDGDANVYHHPGNARHTGAGSREVGDYVTQEYDGEVKKWDAIVFNYGLWDIAYRGGFDGRIWTPPRKFEKRLDIIAGKIKELAPEAKVFWANITAIPKGGTKMRKEGDSARYNEIAAKVMDKYDIPTIDLHTLTKNFDDTCMIVNNVHFQHAGYEKIAELVKSHIDKAIQ